MKESDQYFSFKVKLSPERIIYKRSIYTTLDWLGDVGGLSDALRLLGSGIMYLYTLAFGNSLNMFLLRKIFIRDSKRGKEIKSKTREGEIAKLSTRKRFKMGWTFCCCYRHRHERRLSEIGLKRAMKKLEVDQFIRS